MNMDTHATRPAGGNSQQDPADSPEIPQPDLEHLWQFAGQGLRSSDFNTAMVHFYRGEVARSNTWRSRLDITTNWAVVATGAALSFAFSDASHPPTVILINTMLILLFLFIETRRYRYYELWTYRVRLMETNFFAGLLSPPFLPHADWAEKITESLRHPTFPVSLLEAFGRRYRRNYAPIFLILVVSWIGKVYMHPQPVTFWANSWEEFLRRSAIGPFPGWLVLAAGVVFNAALIGIGLFSTALREAKGEVLEGLTDTWPQAIGRQFKRAAWEVLEVEVHVPRLHLFDTRKQLAYIISDEVETIGKALLRDVGRGVTMLRGQGMYTGREHGVLMCALQSNQLASLKKTVNRIDPKAFIIITPVSEVRGQGFRPLEA